MIFDKKALLLLTLSFLLSKEVVSVYKMRGMRGMENSVQQSRNLQSNMGGSNSNNDNDSNDNDSNDNDSNDNDSNDNDSNDNDSNDNDSNDNDSNDNDSNDNDSNDNDSNDNDSNDNDSNDNDSNDNDSECSEDESSRRLQSDSDDDDDCARFVIDCSHIDDAGRADTRSNIEAWIYDGDSVIDIQRLNDGECEEFCNTGRETVRFNGNNCDDADGIRLRTDGANGESALLIDNIRLFIDGRFSRRWGDENGSAWCLSTDATDNEQYWGSFLTSDNTDPDTSSGDTSDDEKRICYTTIRFFP